MYAYVFTHMRIYIYIYIEREREREIYTYTHSHNWFEYMNLRACVQIHACNQTELSPSLYTLAHIIMESDLHIYIYIRANVHVFTHARKGTHTRVRNAHSRIIIHAPVILRFNDRVGGYPTRLCLGRAPTVSPMRLHHKRKRRCAAICTHAHAYMYEQTCRRNARTSVTQLD